jgi:hypothetical protein
MRVVKPVEKQDISDVLDQMIAAIFVLRRLVSECLG